MTRNSRNPNGSRFPGGFAPEPEDDEPKSKSQRKRDMTALQDLGAELESLAKDRLARVPMPEALADAIHQARRITSHEGKRRQHLDQRESLTAGLSEPGASSGWIEFHNAANCGLG